MDHWAGLTRHSELLSPSLVVDRGLVRQNVQAMIAMARGADRLRPHVKTHKMAEVVKLTEAAGVHKHKAATIAEVEMTARAGGQDILLAYPVLGPNIARLAALVENFPQTAIRALVDDPDAARALSAGMSGLSRPLPVLVDLDLGMARTGIDPGDPAFELYRLVSDLPHLEPDGLSGYDGHIHDSDPKVREERARPGIEATLKLRSRLLDAGMPVPRLVMGGTPTFPIHATIDVPGLECSPGTSTIQDIGYADRFADLPFVPAAVLFTRVISRPRPGFLTLDLGHKAVAADPSGPRVRILELPDAVLGKHNEEHLVIETPEADKYPVGTPLLAYPTHICPTSALHRRVYVVENGQLVGEWEVGARDRQLTY